MRQRGQSSRWSSGVVIGMGLVRAAVAPTPATACPTCAAGVRAQVQRGIFDGSFGVNLAATLAPFGIFLGVAAAVHSGVGSRGGSRP